MRKSVRNFGSGWLKKRNVEFMRRRSVRLSIFGEWALLREWGRIGRASARVPSENLFFGSKSVEKPALEVTAYDRAGIGLQMRELLASLKRRPSAA